MLELEDVHAGYGGAEVLHGVSLRVDEGEIVTLVGSNGAGKTTTLGVIGGGVRVRAGCVRFAGVDLRRRRPEHRAGLGIGQVPEGRRLFPTLPVRDNLLLGAFAHRKKTKETRALLEEVLELFPILRERERADAGTLSGGEAQQLAIGRALMSRPRLILLDEPSLGLAPRMVQRVFDALSALSARGVAVLVAEQNAMQALSTAERGYVLERGRVTMHDAARVLREEPQIVATYLGGVTAA
ncbi:ABC transporter ATP-binding protein [Capillimicrobium parvum]|uniref:High-affinity branched-chain amino acid transport ATP-binding protein LivF n=1 Tax=Capillimicrobium parvum TaxID=2884022 RepID=A0A9E6Y1V4_9ACTN|nr:ABC transporter ATP-binding protein [Capillimicrobium parvum]UGS38223.1 High-affinity branched-chain amino acid transport ATP-binding protein LivF [Capillimicrobium parvum]